MSLMNNKFNLSTEQLLDIYKSIFSDNGLNLDWLDEDTVLDDVDINNVPEFYLSIIYILFNDLYESGKLTLGYSGTVLRELDYETGYVDWIETMARDSLSRGSLVQRVSDISFDIGINNIIGTCFQMYLGDEFQAFYGNRFYSRVKRLYYKVFDKGLEFIDVTSSLLKSLNDSINYYMNIVDSSYYTQYRDVLYVCMLLVQHLYYSLGDEDDKDFDGIVPKLSFESLMQRLLLSRVRYVMRYSLADKFNLVKKYRIRESDLTLQETKNGLPGSKADILVRMKSDVVYPTLLFEVKTNESLLNSGGRTYKHIDNINQVSNYNRILGNAGYNFRSVLFHFLSDSHRQEAKLFNHKDLTGSCNYKVNGSYVGATTLYTFVYGKDTRVEDLDVVVTNILNEELEKGKNV